jgi:membrane-associated phospholipid phosphatase
MIARMPLAFPLAAAAGFGVLAGLVISDWPPLDRLDTDLSERARAYGAAHPGWIEVQRQVTDAAETGVLFGVGLASAVVLLLVRRAYAAAALIAAAFVAVPAVWSAFHALLHRPRPVNGFVAIASNGFPSGHAANSATIALVAVLLIWPRAGPRSASARRGPRSASARRGPRSASARRGPRSASLGRAITVAIAAAFVLVIGATRVTLLAHWPSDVVGAWLLVLAIVPPVARAVDRLVPGRPQPTRDREA